MSNKKLFWFAFMLLSLCEFGQFAYSQNPQSAQASDKNRLNLLRCEAAQPRKIESTLPIYAAEYRLPK